MHYWESSDLCDQWCKGNQSYKQSGHQFIVPGVGGNRSIVIPAPIMTVVKHVGGIPINQWAIHQSTTPTPFFKGQLHNKGGRSVPNPPNVVDLKSCRSYSYEM